MIRMLQFVSTLDRVRDEVRVRSLQVLQLAYDVHERRLQQFLTLRINPWAEPDEAWLHSVHPADSPSSPSDVPVPVPWKLRLDPPGGGYGVFSRHCPPPSPLLGIPDWNPMPVQRGFRSIPTDPATPRARQVPLRRPAPRLRLPRPPLRPTMGRPRRRRSGALYRGPSGRRCGDLYRGYPGRRPGPRYRRRRCIARRRWCDGPCRCRVSKCKCI